MKQVSVRVRIENTIRYAHSQEKDIHKHQGQAVYTKLNSFEKIVYTDQDNQEVVLKWFTQTSRLEIKRGLNLLVLIPGQDTRFTYVTDQGKIEMTSETLKLKILPKKLSVKYRLKIDGKSMATYDFSLIYES